MKQNFLKIKIVKLKKEVSCHILVTFNDRNV